MKERQEKFKLDFEPDYFDYLVLSALEYSQQYGILEASARKLSVLSGGGAMNRLAAADTKDFDSFNRGIKDNFLQVAQSALKKYRKSSDVSRQS